jgi:hypothetical protein
MAKSIDAKLQEMRAGAQAAFVRGATSLNDPRAAMPSEQRKWFEAMLATPLGKTLGQKQKDEIEKAIKELEHWERFAEASKRAADRLNEITDELAELAGVPKWERMRAEMERGKIPPKHIEELVAADKRLAAAQAARGVETPMELLRRTHKEQAQFAAGLPVDIEDRLRTNAELTAMESFARFLRPTQLAGAMTSGSAQAAETIAYAMGSRETEFGKLLAELRRERELQEKSNKSLDEIAADIRAIREQDGAAIP